MYESFSYRSNKNLIGQQNKINSLLTPALVLDLDILEKNISVMSDFAKKSGVKLRPHAKTHKCVEIAQQQISAGAIGVCCATIGEAVVMVDNGIACVLITSPVISDQKISELVRLQSIGGKVIVAVDNLNNLKNLNKVMGEADQELDVIIDVDVGLKRTGVDGVEAALELAKFIDKCHHLIFAGIQGYAGHLQHIVSHHERNESVKRDLKKLSDTRDRLISVGLKPKIITGGGTGTHLFDVTINLFTELQVGSYAVMDVEYLNVESGKDFWSYSPALTLQSTVVSSNHTGIATIDAGLKSLATDGPVPIIIEGAPDEAKYEFFGDEHGKILLGDTNTQLDPGDIVRLIVPHCDPTINLHNYYHCIRNNTLVDIWSVAARGMY